MSRGSANQKKEYPRIYGGKELAQWFQQNFKRGELITGNPLPKRITRAKEPLQRFELGSACRLFTVERFH